MLASNSDLLLLGAQPSIPEILTANATGYALVSRVEYNASGLVEKSFDPEQLRANPLNACTFYYYDRVNRLVAVVDNYDLISNDKVDFAKPGTDDLDYWHVADFGASASDLSRNRTTLRTFDSAGRLQYLVAAAADPSTGDPTHQVTQYVYGVTTGTNPNESRFNSNSHLFKVHYPDESTGAPNTSADHTVQYAYNRVGEVTCITDQRGVQIVTWYDGVGRPTRMERSGGGSVTGFDLYSTQTQEYLYDGLGRMTQASAIESSTTRSETDFFYDASLGHLTSIEQNPTGATGTGDSKTLTYAYAAAGDVPRLDELQYPTGGFEIGVDYGSSGDFNDVFGRSTGMHWNGHQTSSGANPHKVEYTYLGLASPVIKKFPFTNTGGAAPIQLDLYSDPNDATPTAGTYFGVDRFGRATRSRWIPSSSFDPTGDAELVDWHYRYNPSINNLLPIARVDRRGSETTTYSDHQLGDDWSYTHDGLYRLAQAMHGTANGSSVVTADFAADSGEWDLDHLGNWLAFALDLTEDGDFLDTGESVDRDHNAANELIEIDSANDLVYDDVGNLISREIDGTLWEYEYDAWNRLTRVYVTAPSDSKKARARFYYNALGQRVLREIDTDSNGVVDFKTRFYYDAGWRIVEEHADEDSNEDSSFAEASILQRVWGPMDSDEMLYYQRDTDADDDTDDCYYALHDALGSVVALLDHTRTIRERVWYTPYGDPVVEPIILGDVNGSGTVTSADFTAWAGKSGCDMGTDACYDIRYDFNLDGEINSSDFTILAGNLGKSAAAAPAGSISGLGNTIGYAGYVWDPALGGAASGQFLARHRWYSPNLGRWTSRDPIGYADGMNLYEYVGGMPLMLVDPMGLYAWYDEVLFAISDFGAGVADSVTGGATKKLREHVPYAEDGVDLDSDTYMAGAVVGEIASYAPYVKIVTAAGEVITIAVDEVESYLANNSGSAVVGCSWGTPGVPPAAPGVYTFIDASTGLPYVGQSGNLNVRYNRHGERIVPGTYRYEQMPGSTKYEREQRETERIKQTGPGGKNGAPKTTTANKRWPISPRGRR